MLQKLLEILVVVAGPVLRFLCVIIALLKLPPRRETLEKCADTHLKDVLAIELFGIDMEMMSTSIQILSQFLRNLYHRELIDLLAVFSIVERLARFSVHQHSHVNKEIKTHFEIKSAVQR